MKKALLSGSLSAMAMATAGCVTSTAPDPLVRQLDVSEALLRHLFSEHDQNDRNPVAFCVGVRERYPGPVVDAPPDLIARLDDVMPTVKAYFECTQGFEVLDAASGRPAITIHVGPTECRVANRCTVMGAYAEATLSGTASEYVLEWRGNRWVVVAQELLAVS